MLFNQYLANQQVNMRLINKAKADTRALALIKSFCQQHSIFFLKFL
ncbi:hypothetical protein FDUTEX481_05078 [Tolypothrix sp. PCC 7601]|nr:hypothetical protein FDUTEX481_05078 [Tolypothrix sp. PCC 7601]